MQRFLTLLLIAIALPLSLSSQSFLRTEGADIVDESGQPYLLRGMGLGGWMLQEGYMLQTAGFANAQYQIREKIEELIGTEDTDAFYDAWLANHVQKADIDSLKSWGFNSVRLPMNYRLYTLSIQEEPVAGEHTWLEKGFALTDSLISWCRQNEMYVVLDLHAAPGGQGQDQGISNYDPSKPSLWESEANQDKTVALWKRLAERYVDEPIVAGYDLINETNWPLDGNLPLYNLYREITDSIRSVDTQHIIFIEGNWFANDFTGLTPPWDDNLVYSPHKYWSTNDQASIQWVLDIREQYNVPLYLGEAGENSNHWFRNAIYLLEEFNIGWAWWPMKKIEDIAGPLAVQKSAGYQSLLDYWNGEGTAPSAATARTTLMDLTERLKIENCRFQPDVIDAMFRQLNSDEAIPYRTQDIPGVVQPTDFDMGQAGQAYFDLDLATYHVSTGNYSAWNQGWVYRNDGVDIEVTEDNSFLSNGYNIGWLGSGEWMQYDINVAESAVYEARVRIASNADNSRFHFSVGDANLNLPVNVPNSGGWQTWQTVTVPNIVLGPEDQKLRFIVDQEGFNLGPMEFIQTGETVDLTTAFVSAITLDENNVRLNLNKPIQGPLPGGTANFEIFVNGNTVPITNVNQLGENGRSIQFTVDHSFRSSELIRISYNGTQVNATDGTSLSNFTQRVVENTIAIIHAVPGLVQAEDYFFQLGIQHENTTDVGGGENVGFLDVGDYLDYYVNVSEPGLYTVNYRTAAESESGQVQMQLIEDGTATTLHTVSFPATGGWQTWTTTPATAELPAGQHQIRIAITAPLFNINWFDFTFLTGTSDPNAVIELSAFPNPTANQFRLVGSLQEALPLTLTLYDQSGRELLVRNLTANQQVDTRIDLSQQPAGNYVVALHASNGKPIYTNQITKN